LGRGLVGEAFHCETLAVAEKIKKLANGLKGHPTLFQSQAIRAKLSFTDSHMNSAECDG